MKEIGVWERKEFRKDDVDEIEEEKIERRGGGREIVDEVSEKW